MTELHDDLKQKIWQHIHGELDEQSDQELLSMARENEAIARAIHARSDLDALITEAVRAEQPIAPESDEEVPSEPYKSGTERERMIPFPVWRRIVGVAAVLTILLSGVYLTIPRGDLHWSSTQIVLLDQTRSVDSSSKESVLNRSSIKKLCSDLRTVIDTAYEDTLGEEGQSWKLRLVITEHAEGALEVRIDAQAAENEHLVLTERRRYESTSAFEAAINDLSKATVLALHGDEP